MGLGRLVWVGMLSFTLSACAPHSTPSPCAPIQRGLDFLASQFNPETGLLRESPTVEPRKYWLTNDNALAAFALKKLDRPALAATITASLRKYAATKNGLIEVVWGEPVEFPPHVAKWVAKNPAESNDLCDPDKPARQDVVCQEQHLDGAIMTNWEDYVDLAFLGALNQSTRGNPAQARRIFDQAIAKFDGTGFPLPPLDKTNSPTRRNITSYETYKVALALYVGTKINALLPDQKQKLLSVLLARQAPWGGFYTHYPDSESAGRDTNVETTSYALLALDAVGCE